MNILLPAAVYLALALLLAIVLGRRLRRNAPPPIDLDAPYELYTEPLTQAEQDAMWARIQARIDGERP